ncbi:MAG: ChbG/HpnK family deacetylase [candidate division KSB1 bacterium]|nr:ChbG/HpnK family deacetylase [candidate division KSB1 bacterium]
MHLTLNCEWQHYKWGPVTDAKTLMDENNYFYSRAGQLYEKEVDLAEVEQELRAQIETALQQIPQLSHLSFHMGTSVGKPRYKRIVKKLSTEFDLPMYLGRLLPPAFGAQFDFETEAQPYIAKVLDYESHLKT